MHASIIILSFFQIEHYKKHTFKMETKAPTSCLACGQLDTTGEIRKLKVGATLDDVKKVVVLGDDTGLLKRYLASIHIDI